MNGSPSVILTLSILHHIGSLDKEKYQQAIDLFEELRAMHRQETMPNSFGVADGMIQSTKTYEEITSSNLTHGR